MHRFLLRAAAPGLLALIPLSGALGHGVVGKRFFPATLATEDPFVADELSLPTVSTIRQRGSEDEPATRETEFSFEWSKRITPDFGVSISETYRVLKPRGLPGRTGFGNLELGAKYQVFTSAEHEFILSIGVEAELGGTGAMRVEAEPFSVITPAVYFGKGFGDLPESMNFLRPFAVTGVVGVAFPTRSTTMTTFVDPDSGDLLTSNETNPRVLEWGFSIQYSLPYLQSFVRDIGLKAPMDRLIPIVEFAFETPLNGDQSGRTTGTINPGMLWAGKYIQLGLEAMIPINARSGSNIGVIGQVHFFLDDIFPTTLGRPLFGSVK